MSDILIAFGWGLLSVLVNPCHLSSIPLIVGLVDRKGECATVRKAGWYSFLFSLGMAVIVVVCGVLLLFFGREFLDTHISNRIFAVIMILAGFNIIGILNVNWHPKLRLPDMARNPVLKYLAFGLLWGLALGTCNITHFLPVLGLSLNRTESVSMQLLFVLAYAIGQMGVITLAGAFAQQIHRVKDWHFSKGWSEGIRIVCGILVVLAGLWLFFGGHDHEKNDCGHHHSDGESCSH